MPNEYITSAELKATLAMTGETFADADIAMALESASRACDGYKHTRFYKADETRFYSADESGYARSLAIDDLVNLGTAAAPTQTIFLDMDGNGTYEETWTVGTEFVLRPANYAADGIPANRIEILRHSSKRFSRYTDGVKVVGSFGWAAVHPNVKQATKLLAIRLLRRKDVPFAILVAGQEMVAAARLGRIDPDVAFLLDKLPGSSDSLVSVQLG